MDVLNLHLLSAVLDNHLYQGNPFGIDPHDITWQRVLDVNEVSGPTWARSGSST
jgi:formyltetrahydrofolate synthetase